MIKVVIIEDDPVISEWLTAIITKSPLFALMYAFSSAEAALAEFHRIDTNLVITDIHLPGKSGIECVSELKLLYPSVQFMMCTVFEDDENIFASLKAGASGYILKNTPSKKVVESLIDLYNGGSPMSSQIARKVMQSFHPVNNAGKSEEFGLSEREREILDWLSKGLRYKEISDKLEISIETVRTHIRNIYQKLQVSSRTDALNKMSGSS